MKCNVSWFGVTGTLEDDPKTPEDAPVIFCQYGLVGPFGGLDNVFATGNFRASTSPTSVNKFPPRVKNTAVGKIHVWRDVTSRELPGDIGIASIRARLPQLQPTEQHIKYQDTHTAEM